MNVDELEWQQLRPLRGYDMKMVLWGCLGFAVAGLAFWIVTATETIPPRPLPLVLLALIFGVSPIGTFWMLFIVIRHEKRIVPYVLLAFIPYFSLGYYFERVRSRNKRDSYRGLLH
jgi:hypothetical protein